MRVEDLPPEMQEMSPEEIAKHFHDKPRGILGQKIRMPEAKIVSPAAQMAAMGPQEPKRYIEKKRLSGRGGKLGRFNLKAVTEVLEAEGLDPTEEIVRIVKKGVLPPEVQVKVLSGLMEYVHSKRRSVEITGADGGAIQVEHVSDDMLMKIAAQALPDADVIDV